MKFLSPLKLSHAISLSQFPGLIKPQLKREEVKTNNQVAGNNSLNLKDFSNGAWRETIEQRPFLDEDLFVGSLLMSYQA